MTFTQVPLFPGLISSNWVVGFLIYKYTCVCAVVLKVLTNNMFIKSWLALLRGQLLEDQGGAMRYFIKYHGLHPSKD